MAVPAVGPARFSKPFYSSDIATAQHASKPYLKWVLPNSTPVFVGRRVAFEDRRLVFVALDLVVLVRKRQETSRVVGFVRQHPLEVFYPALQAMLLPLAELFPFCGVV